MLFFISMDELMFSHAIAIGPVDIRKASTYLPTLCGRNVLITKPAYPGVPTCEECALAVPEFKKKISGFEGKTWSVSTSFTSSCALKNQKRKNPPMKGESVKTMCGGVALNANVYNRAEPTCQACIDALTRIKNEKNKPKPMR